MFITVVDSREPLWYNRHTHMANDKLSSMDSRKNDTEELMRLHLGSNKIPKEQTPPVSPSQEKIRELEQLARKGDLIAFHEWKKLTNNDIVRVEIVYSIPINAYAKCDLRSVNPDIRFESQSFGIGFSF